jgi:hydroxyacylglutathione hydrolase
MTTMTFPFPHHLGSVNCYLVRTGSGFILIDTGFPKCQTALEDELERAGVKAGNLPLILITHGDGDHTGNAAFLRRKFGGRIAVHPLETAALKGGDDTLSRTRSRLQRVFDKIMLAIVRLFINLGKAEGCSPDLLVEEGFDLSPFGWNARVLHVPGHSRGSIGVLTAGRDFLCGDLFWNFKRPSPHPILDDKAAYRSSVERLREARVGTVYPGHGEPFTLERLTPLRR